MNIPQSSFDGDNQTRWPKITAAVWLLLVSALSVINSVGLSRLAEQSRANDQGAHVQALTTRVGDLEEQVAAQKRQPKPITQPDFDAARQALEARLGQAEQAQGRAAHATDLQALQARVGQIETRLKKGPPTVPPPRHTAEATKPKVPEPPFNVVGLELRGGERFLSIATPGASSLRELRLLREGEAIGIWQLQIIEAHAVVFRVEGKTQRIALP
jgi:hypothetical protein